MINANNLKYVNLRDQMAHYMKGNIMCFISGANNFKLCHIQMKNIGNNGPHCDCTESRKADYDFVFETSGYPNNGLYYSDYIGDDINPVLITGSTNVYLNCIYCDNSSSKNGTCSGIKYVGTNNEVNSLNVNIGINDLDISII